MNETMMMMISMVVMMMPMVTWKMTMTLPGFACLALLVCLAQGSTCLYISLVGRLGKLKKKKLIKSTFSIFFFVPGRETKAT